MDSVAPRWLRSAIAAACVALAPACGGMPPAMMSPPEIRVEIIGDLPAGTRFIHTSLTANPTYCDQYSDDSCTQVYQTEFDVSQGRVFRLVQPDSLRTFEYNGAPDDGTGRTRVRVEARADDHCILARGMKLLESSSISIELTPAATRLCSVFIVVAATSSGTVSYGMDQCPPTTTDFYSQGTLCLKEQPKGTPLELKANTKYPFSYAFGRWEGFADCTSRTQPDCTLPMTGPAAVRAVFRAL